MSDWPVGYGRRVLDEVDSTMAEAGRVATGLRRPEWILARRQTAGRGRRGRAWRDPVGNFAATLVLPLDEPAGQAALRSFVTAMALFDACEEVSGRRDGFALKWPNDVLLNGGKLAGILLESSGMGGNVGQLLIGVGVNLRAVPDAVDSGAVPPVALAPETGRRITPEAFLTALAAAFARREAVFRAQGFEPIRAAWLERAARLGEDIVARTGREEWRGIFETVDGEGNLVLSTARGRRAIAAADVFF